jgi:hypothetical protein
LAATLVLEPLLQLVEGFDKFRNTFVLELLRDGLEIHIEPLEPLAYIARFGQVTLERELGTS